MHRNAEIWEKRHERLEAVKRAFNRNADMAYSGARDSDTRADVERQHGRWVMRWTEVEARVWHALCVAKGWRKA